MDIVSLVVSLAAVGISLFALWEAHASRKLSEATSRAVLHVSVDLTDFHLPPGGGQLLITLENTGSSVAKNPQVEYYVFYHSSVPMPGQNALEGVPSQAGSANINDIAPAKSAKTNARFAWPDEYRDFLWEALHKSGAEPGSSEAQRYVRFIQHLPGRLAVFIGVTYTDEASGRKFSDLRGAFSGLTRGNELITPKLEEKSFPSDKDHALAELGYQRYVPRSNDRTTNVRAALWAFWLHTGRWPTEAQGLAALYKDPGVENWRGPYLPADSEDQYIDRFDYRTLGEDEPALTPRQ